MDTYTLGQAVGIFLLGIGVTFTLVAAIVNGIQSYNLRKDYKRKYDEVHCKCECKKWWKQ